MNREDIIRIAQEISGVTYPSGMDGVKIGMREDHLERFAALVAAAEREACAEVCDEMRRKGAAMTQDVLIESVRQMRDVQGMDGNWNYDPYMHGLFNGIEFSLSLLEVREPQFRDAPEKWLCDQPKARIFSQGGRNEM